MAVKLHLCGLNYDQHGARLNINFELRVGDDDGIVLLTTCELLEDAYRSTPHIRKILNQVSDEHTPTTIHGNYPLATTTFMSRIIGPETFIRSLLDHEATARPDNLDEVLKNVKEGHVGRPIKAVVDGLVAAPHDLMTFRSLTSLRRRKRRHSSMSIIQQVLIEDAILTKHKISFWTSTAVLHQLADLWSLNLTEDHLSGLDLTIDYLAKHLPHTGWTP